MNDQGVDIRVVTQDYNLTFQPFVTSDDESCKNQAETIFRFLCINVHWKVLHYLFMIMKKYNEENNRDLEHV